MAVTILIKFKTAVCKLIFYTVDRVGDQFIFPNPAFF